MQTSEQINELAGALAKAQGVIEPVGKNREVLVQTRTGGSYKFKYATLDAIREAIRKPLSDNGIALIQSVDDDNGTAVTLTTSLVHSSGQWMRSHLKVLMENSGNQARGSAISYARRYAISSMLGIVSEEDDDANIVDGNAVKRKADKGMMQEATEIHNAQNAERRANGQPPLRKPKPTRREWAGYAKEDIRLANTVEDVWAYWNDGENAALLSKLEEENHSLYQEVVQVRDDHLDLLRAGQ